MLPFLAPMLLKLSPVGQFLKAIPRQVWFVIAIAAVIGAGWLLHAHSVKKAYRTGYQAGVAAEGLRIAAKAKTIKDKADKLTGRISQALKDKNDAENRAIASGADALRLRGPGKATCPGYSGVSSGPGRSVPASGEADAARPQVPTGDSAAVPWWWLVDRAEQCDLNRAENMAWREWHRQQSEAWSRIR